MSFNRLLTTSFAACALSLSMVSANAQPLLEGYLCCNMRSDANGWISDINYLESGKHVVPAGTPAKIVNYGKNRFEFHTPLPRKNYRLGNDYSRALDMESFALRYIVKQDPGILLASYPDRIRDAIEQMKVTRGMTREQVLMAIGYPIADENPILKASVWKYWNWTFSPFDLHFDRNGVLINIETDARTRKTISVE